MAKRTVKVICEIKVPFHDYGKVSLNKRAAVIIKSQIRNVLKDHCHFIEIEDENGMFDTDCSCETIIKVKGDLM